MSKKNQYSEQDIAVLKGLEPVQQRPGMYTDTQNPNHIMEEVIANAQDEALAGFATEISVELHEDGSVTVEDNGRGIPCGMHPTEKLPVIEVVFTVLHAGGKFKKGEGQSYGFTGGLHGVGVSVTNALSSRLEATVWRDGHEHTLAFENGAVVEPLKKKKLPADEKNRTGTRVRSYPNPKYFDHPSVQANTLENLLRSKAVLLKGVGVTWKRPGKSAVRWCFPNGFEQYLKDQIQNDDAWIAPVFVTEQFYKETNGSFDAGEGFELAVGWTDGKSIKESFVNLVLTKDGGRHETGLRAGLLDAFRKVAERMGALPKNIKLEAEDVWSMISFVLSVKLLDPQFQNQTKDKMTSEKGHRLVSGLLSDAMELWLNDHPNYAKDLIEVMVQNAISRSKQSVKMERKKTAGGMVLPGKLADCLSNDVNNTELFLVEGDSAAGCFSADTKVALTDGRDVDFLTLIEEDQQGKKNFCYTILEDGSVGVGEIKHPRLTKKSVEIISLHLDNGEVIKLTPDHKCMLRDGSYQRADQLNVGQSLMPLYRRVIEKDTRNNLGKPKAPMMGYEEVLDPSSGKWLFTHRLADDFNIRYEVYSGKINGKFARHHVDFNKKNNNPTNIVRLGWVEHIDLHKEWCREHLHNEDVFAKLRDLKKTHEFRKFMSDRMKEPQTSALLSKNSKDLWKDEAYKDYMKNCWFEFYSNNKEYREKTLKTLNESQQKYWSSVENRSAQSVRVREYFVNNPEHRQNHREMAINQWKDKDLRAWRASKTANQWTDEYRKQRRTWSDAYYYDATMPEMKKIYDIHGCVDSKNYEAARLEKKDRKVMKLRKFVDKYFNGSMDALHDALHVYNHKVVKIEKVDGLHDVYDLEVPVTHNFALASGVFVHNSSKQGRDKETQAILALRGKILNTWEVDTHKIMSSEGISNIASAIGVDPHTLQDMDKADLSKLRYGKIFTMADADVDGQHIQVLLLTLFYRHFPALIKNGHIWIAQAPLFRIDAPAKKGTKTGPRKIYALDDDERESIIRQLEKEGVKESQYQVSRFKGLGEMNADQLRETTMNKDSRRSIMITLNSAEETIAAFDRMMGGKNAAQRKKWMEECGADIDVD